MMLLWKKLLIRISHGGTVAKFSLACGNILVSLACVLDKACWNL